MVPEARLELARLERRGILNPLCISIQFENYLLRGVPCTEPIHYDPATNALWIRQILRVNASL